MPSMVSLFLLAVLRNTAAALILSSAPFAGISNSTLINSTSSIIPQANNAPSIATINSLAAETVSVVTVYRLVEQTQTKYVNFCACPSSMTHAAGNQVSSSSIIPDSSLKPQDSDTGHSVPAQAGSVASKGPEVVDAAQSQQDQHFITFVTIATVYQTLEPGTYTTTITVEGSPSVQTLTAISTETRLTTSTVTLPVIATSSSGSGVDSKPIYNNSTISIGTSSTPSPSATSTQFATSIVTSIFPSDKSSTASSQTTSSKFGAGIDGEGRSTTTMSYRVETSSATIGQIISLSQSFTTSIVPTTTSSRSLFTETSTEGSSTLPAVSSTSSDYTTASASQLLMSSPTLSSSHASVTSTISSSSFHDLTTSGLALSSPDTISSTLTTAAASHSMSIVSTTYTTYEATSTTSSTDIATSSNLQSSSSSDMPSNFATSSLSSTTSFDLSSSTSSTTTLFTTTSIAKPVAAPSQQAVVNPDFEMDLDGSGTYTQPWVFSGNGNVQSSTNNAYQAYSGAHFAVLYGRSSTTASLSQTLLGVEPGFTYTLSYFYNVEQASPQAICRFVTTLGGQVVDSITSPTVRTGGYLNRQVAYMPPTDSDGTVLLQLTLTCPRYVQLTAQSNFALDLITLTLNSQS